MLLQMDERRALILIGADAESREDTEALTELLEDAVFEHATYFMRRAFIPKLAEARIRKLGHLREAAAVLGLSANAEVPDAVPDPAISDLAEAESPKTILQIYHKRESEIKQILSAAERPEVAEAAFKTWVALYLAFAEKFCDRYEAQFPELSPDPEAKLSEYADFNEVSLSLKSGGGEGSALHRYYSRLFKIAGARGE